MPTKARRAMRPPPVVRRQPYVYTECPAPHLWVRVCGFCALCADLGDHVCLGDRGTGYMGRNGVSTFIDGQGAATVGTLCLVLAL